jgi:hypothetical protein
VRLHFRSSEWQRTFVPDGAGSFAVTDPPVSLVSRLGTAAKRCCDLGPRGAGDQRLGHRHVSFEAECFPSSGERLNLSQSSGHVYRGHPRIINAS